jgi:DNA-binding response OmpR family regulator
LTRSEYQLLAVLMSRPDEVLSRQELAQLAWGYTHVNGSRSVDMYVSRLRAKLDSGALPSLAIVSVRRRGYKLVPEPGGV